MFVACFDLGGWWTGPAAVLRALVVGFGYLTMTFVVCWFVLL